MQEYYKILNISSDDYFSIAGENYGSIVINSDTFISKKLYIQINALSTGLKKHSFFAILI